MATKLKILVIYLHRSKLLNYALKTNVDQYNTFCNYPFYKLDVSRYNVRCPILSIPYSSSSSRDTIISDDDEVRYIDINHEIQTLKFHELKKIAEKQYNEKGRNLVQVKLNSDKYARNFDKTFKQQTATFRILQPSELEELVRKSKQHRKGQSFQILSPTLFMTSNVNCDQAENSVDATNISSMKSSKIGHKNLPLKVGIAEHDLQSAIKRITKWLNRRNIFVTVVISTSGKKVEGTALEKNIRTQLESVEGIENLSVKVQQ